MNSYVPFNGLAEIAIGGKCLTPEQCYGILGCTDENLLLLLHEAYRVRREYFETKVHVHVLTNAKSGWCSEDCHYCSQSKVSRAVIDRYPLVSNDTLIMNARRAKKIGATRFCISTSGVRPNEDETDQLCETIRNIKQNTEIPLCATLGLLNTGQAKKLKAAGLDRVNHNLNTSRRHYSRICTTHTFQDRLDTIARCQDAGLEICSGFIVGQGETDNDIIDMLLNLREIKPQSIPINFLIPIEGTPFEGFDTKLNPNRCLKILCLTRFINPRSELRAAGGWEYHMGNLKSLALYAVDSIFVTGYLTTPGTSVKEICKIISDMGLESTLEDTGDL